MQTKFSDLPLPWQHQLLISIKLAEMTCIAMSDVEFYVVLAASVEDKTSPLN